MRKRFKFIIPLAIIAVLVISGYFYLPKYFASVMYPLSYRAEIKAAANEFGLNPNFICAVIFTESRFNPRANSGVGARGLMQLMPSTAKGLAGGLGDTTYSADKLYEPARNIRYGSYYLKGLMDKYNQNVDYVLMHYNGGGGAVQRYQRNGGLPRETRGFVYKVKSTKDMYDQIYGEWWNREEFNKPDSSSPVDVTNIREFWRILITVGDTSQ